MKIQSKLSWKEKIGFHKLKNCKKCGTNFEILDEDITFYDKISPTFNWTKYNIPTPTLCPECRQQRRYSFLNERKLYKNKCAITGKPLITVYSPEKPYIIYHKDEWDSDRWDALDYGQDFNFSKTFAEQFDKLMKKVPRPHNLSMENENSEYAYSWFCKNCYLFFVWAYCESCYYSEYTINCSYCVDCNDLHESENCYQCMESIKLYKCIELQKSENCNNCSFGFNLQNCKNCLFCYNLNNKEYCIENKQYSKEDYEEFIEEADLWNHQNYLQALEKFENMKEKFIVKNLNLINCENCLWDNLKNCKNIQHAYWWTDSEDCKFSYMCNYNNDCYDTSSYKSNHCYEMMSGWPNLKNCMFGFDLGDNVDNTYYCNFCYNSSHLFWCIWLKHKKYCIFNKQYTKEEYEILVPKIIEHMKTTWEWGEFFPSNISPFGYNETVAMEYFPMERKDAIKRKYKWMDAEYPINIPDGMAKIESIYLVDLDCFTPEIEKEIANSAIICEESWKPYRITEQELEFYKKQKIPLPRKHHDIRYQNRIAKRTEKKLYNRQCDKCEIDIISTYPSDSSKTVYCQNCYSKEIY